MPFITAVKPCNRRHRQRAIAATLERFPTGDESVRAILDVFGQATAAEYSEGMTWYSGKARQACDDIRAAVHATYGRTITHRTAAGILAALSPATGWGDNVAGSLEFVITGRMLAQTPLFNERAARILNGERPESVLGGRKVRSFFANLAEPTQSGPVTIDRHALSILFRRPLSERQQKEMLSLGGYTFAAAAYRAAARRIGIRPHELQAITWVVWRRLNPYRGRNANATHSVSFSDPSTDTF